MDTVRPPPPPSPRAAHGAAEDEPRQGRGQEEQRQVGRDHRHSPHPQAVWTGARPRPQQSRRTGPLHADAASACQTERQTGGHRGTGHISRKTDRPTRSVRQTRKPRRPAPRLARHVAQNCPGSSAPPPGTPSKRPVAGAPHTSRWRAPSTHASTATPRTLPVATAHAPTQTARGAGPGPESAAWSDDDDAFAIDVAALEADAGGAAAE